MEKKAYQTHLSHVLNQITPAAILTNQSYAADIRANNPQYTGLILEEESIALHSDYIPTRWQNASSDDTAIIQHSSGSTGLQKGVALSHQMILRQCESYAKAIQLDSNHDAIASWIPLYHDMGLFTTWLLPLLHGVRVYAIDPFEWIQKPSSFLKLISDHKATLAWQPNFAYQVLASRVTSDEMQGVNLSSVRGISNCSEPARAKSHDLFLNRFENNGLKRSALWVCYAMAENSFAVTTAGSTTQPVELSPSGVLSVGIPIEGCLVTIVDETRRTLKDPEVGEVAIQSPFLLKNYYRNEEATQKNLDPDGWYYTGDMGFLNQGQLYITGRKKDLIIVGGRNFYPQDLEAIMDDCEGTLPGRSVALSLDDESSGTSKIILLAESVLTDTTELSALIRRQIYEELDCPVSEVHIVPPKWLLKTTSGKIARRPNLERYLGGEMPKPISISSAATQTPPSWPEMLGWSLAIALTLCLGVILKTNSSWAVYSQF